MSDDFVAICSGVTRTYQEDLVPVHALRGVDFSFSRGDFVSLAGPSGSGKSTLLNIMGGLDRPDAGSVTVDGVALNDLNETQLSDLRLAKMGFVFQSYNLIPVLSAQENVEFIMQLQGVAPAERAERATATLAALDMAELAHRRPGELSGGQQQRVAIARAIVTDPVLLLADEPSAKPGFGDHRGTAAVVAAVERGTGRFGVNRHPRSGGHALCQAAHQSARWLDRRRLRRPGGVNIQPRPVRARPAPAGGR